MSVTLKFTVSDENYNDLSQRAASENLSIQDYIRTQLFPSYVAFTPREAVKRALAKSPKERFAVPELFGSSWDLPNGVAGQFGKSFRELVETEYQDEICCTDTYNKKGHMIYERL